MDLCVDLDPFGNVRDSLDEKETRNIKRVRFPPELFIVSLINLKTLASNCITMYVIVNGSIVLTFGEG